MYRLEVHTTESGSVVRIIKKKTAEYVLVGGFEGMQRYASRNRIRWNKMAVVCLTSPYEIVPVVSSVLTQGIHNNYERKTVFLSTEEVSSMAEQIGISIGNMDFFGKYRKDSKIFPDIEMIEKKGVSYILVPLSEKKGGFDIEKANSCGIVRKMDIIQINKTGEVEIEGRTHYISQFRKETVFYPRILIITLLSEKYILDQEWIKKEIENSLYGMDVFIRAGPEVFRRKKDEHRTLAMAADVIEMIYKNRKKIAEKDLNIPDRYSIKIYVILSTEEEALPVKDFYDRICPVYPYIIRPLVYHPKYTNYLRRKNVLTNSSYVEYEDTSRNVFNQWERGKNDKSEKNEKSPSASSSVKDSLLLSSECIAPYVVFLGTAAAVPGVIRNVSSILTTSAQGSVLLDCGEDTHTQLSKISSGYAYNYRSIRIIVLTHRHADHILGIFSVLRRCNELGNKSVVVLGNSCMVSALMKFGISCIFIPNREDLLLRIYRKGKTDQIVISTDKEEVSLLVKKGVYSKEPLNIDPFSYKPSSRSKECFLSMAVSSVSPSIVELVNLELKYSLDIPSPKLSDLLYEVDMCSALHINESYSVRVKEYVQNIPYSVVYSGDTLPNRKFSELGTDADVMIHEGTFEQGEIGYARSTNHSTVTEAVEIFRKSQAKTLFVTHFSQRYKTVTVPEDIYLAMDYMVYSPGNRHSQALLHKSLYEWANKLEEDPLSP